VILVNLKWYENSAIDGILAEPKLDVAKENTMRTIYRATNLQTGESIRVSALCRLDAAHQAAYCFSCPLKMVFLETL